jgi:methionyl-tRNA formyltransferase
MSLFIGSKKIGYDVLKKMFELAPEELDGVITIDDRWDTRSYYNTIHEFCTKNAIRLEVAVNRKHSEELMFKMATDLCVVVGWYWLIGKELVEKFRFVGIHNSLLPKFRGCAPLVWAMIVGSQHVGTSLFSFTEGMDDGDIWSQKEYLVKETDYIGDVLEVMESYAVEMIEESYVGMISKSIIPKPQPQFGATYCGMRTPEDGLIDWSWPAESIYNFIRAQSRPYPGAFTLYEGAQVTIWRAKPLKYTYIGTPGQILEPNLVCCGNMRPIRLLDIEGDVKLLSPKIRLGS